MQRVLEVYDNYIWKELDKTDATVAEVRDFMNIVSTNDFSFSSLSHEFLPHLNLGILKCCGSASAVVRA